MLQPVAAARARKHRRHSTNRTNRSAPLAGDQLGSDGRRPAGRHHPGRLRAALGQRPEVEIARMAAVSGSREQSIGGDADVVIWGHQATIGMSCVNVWGGRARGLPLNNNKKKQQNEFEI